ncbi:MAG: UDP-glucose/GDP-mannose dehydrogenase family protein [Rhodospirillales bacterium]|nr:UDP-glucose/GDP-mannose dehydrogenase family protein [Rhodospirillales bacterium]
MNPVIGYAGMTHLGLNSSAAAAERGFDVVCFDADDNLVEELRRGVLPVVEPKLPETLAKNENRLTFTSNAADLVHCGVVYVAPDVFTGDDGASDLSPLQALMGAVDPHISADAVRVILSQVPPGFSRACHRDGKLWFYQVETLIFGQAVDRALNPERFIIGCADPEQPLPKAYQDFLTAFDCPILPMRYESAELAKIAINCCLVASISVANTLAELCENIGADWSEIVPALKSDKRIGENAYLNPGLGIAGGNLERDMATVIRLSEHASSDASVVKAWKANSEHRKLAAARILEEKVLPGNPDPLIAVWGLAYKEGTHSTKNSPSLATLAAFPKQRFRVHDPVVLAEEVNHAKVEIAEGPLEAAAGADVLMILTPWQDYKEIDPALIAEAMSGKVIIDPYRVVTPLAAIEAGLDHYTLGVAFVPTWGES